MSADEINDILSKNDEDIAKQLEEIYSTMI